MRVVVALGGNALLRRGEAPESAAQRRNVDRAVASIAELAREHEVVLTHGNGPQVGLLALQSEAYTQVQAYPLEEANAALADLAAGALRGAAVLKLQDHGKSR